MFRATMCPSSGETTVFMRHIVAQNTYRLINILRNKRTMKNCAPSWLYLQDYKGMRGQQNIIFVYACRCLTIPCEVFPSFSTAKCSALLKQGETKLS